MAFVDAEPPPGSAAAAGCYRIDDLLIDTGIRRVTRNGADLAIANLSFDLLLTLMHAAPRLVTFDALMQQVWPGVVVSPETVTQRVKLLRQALGDNADSPRYILAVRGHGYRLLATPVPVVDSGSAAPAIAPSAKVSAVPARRRLLAAVLVAVLVAAGGLWWVRLHAPGAVTGTGSSIAVMPFANLTGDPAKDYLGDGMAEELIDALARMPGIKVPPRSATFAYRGHNADLRRIAQDLGVATILEGDLRSVGERIRISTRLLDAQSGTTVWTQNYDRPFADLFKLQDDLAAETAQALRGQPGNTLPTAAAREPPTRDLEAYRLYLQARAVGRGSPETEAQAVTLINQALARDPNFARALAYRAFVPANMPALGYAEPKQALDAAQRDTQRALTLSPDLSDALAGIGSIHVTRGEWVAGELSYRAALASDPS